jgi:hypothetical protein
MNTDSALQGLQGHGHVEMELLVSHGLEAQLLQESDQEMEDSALHTEVQYNPPSRHKSALEIFTLRGWLWECLGLLLATSSLVGAVALLLVYRDKPTPKWRVGITLNAILSIASTSYRSGLAVPIASSISQFGWLRFESKPHVLDRICKHDSASRGPMGSLLFITKSNITYVLDLKRVEKER